MFDSCLGQIHFLLLFHLHFLVFRVISPTSTRKYGGKGVSLILQPWKHLCTWKLLREGMWGCPVLIKSGDWQRLEVIQIWCFIYGQSSCIFAEFSVSAGLVMLGRSPLMIHFNAFLWDIFAVFVVVFFHWQYDQTRKRNVGGQGEVGRQWRWGAKERIRGLVKAAGLDSFHPSSAEKLLWNSLWLLKGRCPFIQPLKEIILIGSRITKTLTTCCQECRSGFVCCAECFFSLKTAV